MTEYFGNIVDLANIFSKNVRVFGFNWNSIFRVLHFEVLHNFNLRYQIGEHEYRTIDLERGQTVSINDTEGWIRVFD